MRKPLVGKLAYRLSILIIMLFFQSKFFCWKKNKFILLNDIPKIFVDEYFNRDLALADWRTVYHKETAMKCLLTLTEFFLQHSRETHQQRRN